MGGRITLMIPKQFFTKDFLEIEVKKHLGVRGDDLIQYFRGDMRELHKNNKRSKLFNHNMVYDCRSTVSNVVLVGSKI